MSPRLQQLSRSIRLIFTRRSRQASGAALDAAGAVAGTVSAARFTLLVAAVATGSAYLLWKYPPVQAIGRGEVAVRSNLITGSSAELHEGKALVVPGLHEVRRFSLRDQVFRPVGSSKANGPAPFQSVEGLSIGVDLAVRYALDPSRVSAMAKSLPDDIDHEVVQPAVQGVIYKTFTRYTVREIFSSKRAEIQAQIEAELKPRLASDGIVLRSVQIGQVDLPADYRAGMDRLLTEELKSEKMRFTLALKEKQVQQTALEAEAQKVRREKEAEAAAQEQVIAAKAQEEAMKHVLPFKEKQIQQRQLEAEADKQSRIRTAEGQAQARRIESQGEADSRQKLADAEVYRLDKVGRINSEQMAREGDLISRHPLLIQKTMADKLSDKIQVIIAPPAANGDFVGSGLIGNLKPAGKTQRVVAKAAGAADEADSEGAQ